MLELLFWQLSVNVSDEISEAKSIEIGLKLIVKPSTLTLKYSLLFYSLTFLCFWS